MKKAILLILLLDMVVVVAGCTSTQTQNQENFDKYEIKDTIPAENRQ